MSRKKLTDEERKQKRREYNKKYRERNREQLNARQRNRYQNDEEFRQRQLDANRKYQQNHRDKVNMANKKYRLSKQRPDYIKTYMREYRRENRCNIHEKELEYKRRTRLVKRIKNSNIQMDKLIDTLLEDIRTQDKQIMETVDMNEYNYDTREKMFQDIVNNMLTIYKNKNKDYGGSVTETYNKFGLTSFLVRLSDKLNRLITINDKKEILVTDEKIEDTLIDLANYAVLALIELKLNKGEK